MTFLGGDNNRGTVFQMNTNGTGFALLHEFSAGADGAYPFGSLTLAGSTLYGVTSEGGSANDGIVFQIDLDGSGYSVLHTFTGGTDGGFPVGPLTLVGTNLYGMTSGRSSFGGTLYKIATNGTGYTPLYQFATAGDEFPSDPHGPAGGLTLVGSTLYGMTDSEGSSSNGTIFKINLDGSGFTNLHLFLGGSTDGSHPDGSLTLVGSTLYGMTAAGGISNEGVIFQVETNGFSYQLLHMFKGGAPDGTEPHGSLVMSDTALYGMTAFGGSNNTCTIFKYDTVPEPSSFILVCAGALLLMARRRQ
jgi:uncharacterized repeat protein (TIGR03803 family)